MNPNIFRLITTMRGTVRALNSATTDELLALAAAAQDISNETKRSPNERKTWALLTQMLRKELRA